MNNFRFPSPQGSGNSIHIESELESENSDDNIQAINSGDDEFQQIYSGDKCQPNRDRLVVKSGDVISLIEDVFPTKPSLSSLVLDSFRTVKFQIPRQKLEKEKLLSKADELSIKHRLYKYMLNDEKVENQRKDEEIRSLRQSLANDEIRLANTDEDISFKNERWGDALEFLALRDENSAMLESRLKFLKNKTKKVHAELTRERNSVIVLDKLFEDQILLIWVMSNCIMEGLHGQIKEFKDRSSEFETRNSELQQAFKKYSTPYVQSNRENITALELNEIHVLLRKDFENDVKLRSRLKNDMQEIVKLEENHKQLSKDLTEQTEKFKVLQEDFAKSVLEKNRDLSELNKYKMKSLSYKAFGNSFNGIKILNLLKFFLGVDPFLIA